MAEAIPNYGAAIDAFARNFIGAREREQQVARQMDQNMIEAAKQNPALWDDPRTVKAAETVYGKDAAPLVVNAYRAASDPEHPANTLLQRLSPLLGGEGASGAAPAPAAAPTAAPSEGDVLSGLTRGILGPEAPRPPLRAAEPAAAPAAAPAATGRTSPYAGSTQRLVAGVRTIPGASINLSSKGGVSVSITGRTQEQVSEGRFYRATEMRRRELEAEGVPEVAAHLQALREATAFADENNLGASVPKDVRELVDAKTHEQIKARLKAVTKRAERAVELETAAELEFEKERGGRSARTDVPITPDEVAASRAIAIGEKLGLTQEQVAGLTNELRVEAAAVQTGAEAEAREKGTARGRLAPGAPQPTPAAARTDLVNIQQTVSQLGKVADLLQPALLGPAAGRVADLRGALGLVNLTEERFRAAIDNVVRAYRMTTTGQAAPESELARLKSELLNLKQSPQQFIARLVELYRQMRDNHGAQTTVLKANNEVTVPLDIPETLSGIVSTVEAEAAPPAAAAGGLPEGWRLEPVPTPAAPAAPATPAAP